ncbi:MAG: hypothetical protein F4153_09830 [Acidimicrobiia bacterium]|nr:hypothetical protein [Acidimicrobiia bacterium]
MFSVRGRSAAAGIAVTLLVTSLVAMPADAQLTSQPSATLQDIEVRDELIANQETLLNVYRCLFNVDVHAVPGGCANNQPSRGPTQPGSPPSNPTQQDISARDMLIANQEDLLNAYRCQLEIDTQLVPGGCQTDPNPTLPIPTGNETYSAVAAGWGHSCAIATDQAITCWGEK